MTRIVSHDRRDCTIAEMIDTSNTAAVFVQRLDAMHAPQAISLLDLLRVSLFGVESRRLHEALVRDGLADRVDCRIALSAGAVCGVVLAAPRRYWTSALLMHWGVASDCIRARVVARAHASRSSPAGVNAVAAHVVFDAGSPS